MERIRGGKGRIRKSGTDYLAYCLIDIVVDNYFGLLERLGEKIELLEEDLVTNPTPEILSQIHNFKMDMIFLRRSVWPLREVINMLALGESNLIKESSRPYFRDVYRSYDSHNRHNGDVSRYCIGNAGHLSVEHQLQIK